MATQCSEGELIFHGLDSREVAGRFDGGEITSDAGAVLLREMERRIAIVGWMSECLEGHCDPERIFRGGAVSRSRAMRSRRSIGEGRDCPVSSARASGTRDTPRRDRPRGSPSPVL